MLRTRRKRLAQRGEAAVQRLSNIEASVASLDNEDLLDLADIFKADPHTPLREVAFAEMARRNIKL